MLKLVNKIYPVEKIRKMNNLEFDPYKKKLVRKCKSGYYRNLEFVCALTKKTKISKRERKTQKNKPKTASKTGWKKKSSSKKTPE